MTMPNNCRSLAECAQCHVLFVPGRSWTVNCCSKRCAAIYTSFAEAIKRRFQKLRFSETSRKTSSDFIDLIEGKPLSVVNRK